MTTLAHQPGDVKGALTLLRSRISGRSSRGQRDDNSHLALAIEGGGMRGAALAGMLLALEDLGSLEAFDSIHGSSVGGHLATYFATGEARVAMEIFTHEALDKRFISFGNVFSGRSVMNLHWMVDEVFLGTRAISFERLPDCPPLWLTSTDCTTGEAVRFRGTNDIEELRLALKATAMIPLIAGMAIKAGSRRLVDGGIAEPIPLGSASAAGATHVVALSSYRSVRENSSLTIARQAIESWLLRLFYGKALSDKFESAGEISGLNNSIQLDTLFVPDHAPTLGWLMRDEQALRKLGRECYETTLRLMRDSIS